MIQRSSVPARLAQMFCNDHKKVMKSYPPLDQIELTKYLLNLITLYSTGQEVEESKRNWINADLERLKRKYGKTFKTFHNAQFHLYFHFHIVLAAKGIYNAKEFGKLKEQGLSEKEQNFFLSAIANGLSHSLDGYYLECDPEESSPLDGDGKAGKKKKRILKRIANDGFTRLSREETVGLMALLQEEKVLLQDEFLTNVQAGEGIEILTGYSQDTVRLIFPVYKEQITHENVKSIDNLLSRLRVRTGKLLKEK